MMLHYLIVPYTARKAGYKMTKPYAISKERFNGLPKAVQEQARVTLTCFNKCYIDYEYGQYKASSMIGITSTYAPDHKSIGIVYADDIYTPAERKGHYKELEKCIFD
jgi:hypothetical protein